LNLEHPLPSTAQIANLQRSHSQQSHPHA
jgi:hypothetical protein